MKQFTIAGVLLLFACSPPAHNFAVNVENAASPVATAYVSLCGEPAWPLSKSGTQFTGVVANRCEGHGNIRLRFADGGNADCPIGYVTTLEDQWKFEVRGRSCVPVKDAPA